MGVGRDNGTEVFIFSVCIVGEVVFILSEVITGPCRGKDYSTVLPMDNKKNNYLYSGVFVRALCLAELVLAPK